MTTNQGAVFGLGAGQRLLFVSVSLAAILFLVYLFANSGRQSVYQSICAMLVGCVIVRNGRVIGEGYHKKFGEAHAEREALAVCNESPRGANVYVNLEPCCHNGGAKKTPPCVPVLIEAGVVRVVLGCVDPNPA